MTGLVLEGGALRTIYSSGVCDGLLEADAPMPDYVVGVSAGIAYGVS
ncbi:MAG: patatin-like phospholipase family protein, partial [Oscillospiraceae bacterium]